MHARSGLGHRGAGGIKRHKSFGRQVLLAAQGYADARTVTLSAGDEIRHIGSCLVLPSCFALVDYSGGSHSCALSWLYS